MLSPHMRLDNYSLQSGVGGYAPAVLPDTGSGGQESLRVPGVRALRSRGKEFKLARQGKDSESAVKFGSHRGQSPS